MKKSPNGAPEALCDEKKIQERSHKLQNEVSNTKKWFESLTKSWDKAHSEDFPQLEKYHKKLTRFRMHASIKWKNLREEEEAMEVVLIEHLKSLEWEGAMQKPLGQKNPTTTILLEYLNKEKYPKSVVCRLDMLGYFARCELVESLEKPLNPGFTLFMKKISNDEKTRKKILVWADCRLRSLTMESMVYGVVLEIKRLLA